MCQVQGVRLSPIMSKPNCIATKHFKQLKNTRTIRSGNIFFLGKVNYNSDTYTVIRKDTVIKIHAMRFEPMHLARMSPKAIFLNTWTKMHQHAVKNPISA